MGWFERPRQQVKSRGTKDQERGVATRQNDDLAPEGETTIFLPQIKPPLGLVTIGIRRTCFLHFTMSSGTTARLVKMFCVRKTSLKSTLYQIFDRDILKKLIFKFDITHFEMRKRDYVSESRAVPAKWVKPQASAPPALHAK